MSGDGKLPHLAAALADVPSRPHGSDEAELTPWMRGALDVMRETTRAGVHYPVDPASCPYDSGAHRAKHEILARREWQLPMQRVPIVLRVGVVLVAGGALLFPGIVQRKYRP